MARRPVGPTIGLLAVAVCPALAEVSGPVVLLDLALECGVLAGTIVASMAQERGLVAYDLMVGMLRPVSDDVIAEHTRRWASPLN